MKTTNWIKCPICSDNVAINPRTHTIRKHRIGGQQSGDICSGSHRLSIRPAPTEETIFINDFPIFTTNNELAHKITELVDCEVKYLMRSDLMEEYGLHNSVAKVECVYLPERFTDFSSPPMFSFMRSRTCPDMIYVHLRNNELKRSLSELLPVLEEQDDVVASMLRSNITTFKYPTRYSLPEAWEIDLHLASALIISTQEHFSKEVAKFVWYILTHGRLPLVTDTQRPALMEILIEAKTHLVRSNPPKLREALMTLIDIQDYVNATQH